ncbi:uroporphyrinogen-III C-methyltransferase [Pelobacter seleniigenes]|uniref:uroporphyrinogen-III C-methyltransferase n=1 Tax=Pelobacter seleniigenes TaxID=407188 RepID=UPI00068B1543|nr:uroporphyrinogen-III C-methyltransferase [Pelobacter seleniigenes]
MNTESLPILLTKPELLIIGGGQAALQKARTLQQNGLTFRIVAEQICDELKELGQPYQERSFCSTDLLGATLVVDATGNPDLPDRIKALKSGYQFLFNCVSQPELSDFHFSALLNYGQLKIAVSTNGCSPTIGQVVRDKIAATIPADLDSLVRQKKVERLQGIIAPQQTAAECRSRLAKVYLIGCGPGDPELLTLKAYKLIQQMDVVLYDHLLTPEIMDLIPAGTEKIAVGKQKGCHSFRQEQINELLFQKTRQGLRIARLKCGDPYIFGRGAEEAEYLIKRGVQVEVVSGISSALAGPACAGIPPTARGYATNMSVVSAHLAGSKINADWFPLLKIPHHTTVVLMGVSFAREISQLALSQGVPANLPVAIVANATRSNQQVLITDLQNLPLTAEQAQRPALLVFGDVVNLHHVLAPAAEQLYQLAQ